VPILEALLVSAAVVALAEFGDKTQLLALMLAARFRQPLPIIAGMFCATLGNHAVSGLAGTYFGSLLEGPWLRWILAISFLAIAVWTLFPDRYQDDEDSETRRWGAFLTTLGAFFLAEFGDKTQIATIGLAARYGQFVPVVAGTILGMMLVDIPTVLIGDRVAARLPLRAIRVAAAAMFAAIGVVTLVEQA
jgi:putative Ca2+/H+ antiporter (TMEM165/GDT1 family)